MRIERFISLSNRLAEIRVTGFDVISTALLYFIVTPSRDRAGTPWWAACVAEFMLFCFVFIRHSRQDQSREERDKAIYLAKLAVFPTILFTIWALLLMVVGIAGYYQATRPISTLLQYGLILTTMISLAWEYGRTAVDRFFWVIAVAAFVSFLEGIAHLGLPAFVSYLLGSDSVPHKWFELHDIGLTAPMFLIYYFEIERTAPHRYMKAFVALSISLVCLKRIAIAAAVVAILASFFIRVKAHEKGQLIVRLFEWLLVALACAWVFMTGTDIFSEICAMYGVNPMGRTYVYAYFRKYLSFSPEFFGQGLGFTSWLLQSITNTVNRIDGAFNIQAIHNDVLRIYIENGPWLFLFWAIYSAVHIPRAVGRRFGLRAERAALLVTTYAFIVYLTDNTTAYFCFQLAIYLMIFSFLQDEETPLPGRDASLSAVGTSLYKVRNFGEV